MGIRRPCGRRLPRLSGRVFGYRSLSRHDRRGVGTGARRMSRGPRPSARTASSMCELSKTRHRTSSGRGVHGARDGGPIDGASTTSTQPFTTTLSGTDTAKLLSTGSTPIIGHRRERGGDPARRLDDVSRAVDVGGQRRGNGVHRARPPRAPTAATSSRRRPDRWSRRSDHLVGDVDRDPRGRGRRGPQGPRRDRPTRRDRDRTVSDGSGCSSRRSPSCRYKN